MRHRSVYVDTAPRPASTPPSSLAAIKREEASSKPSSLPLIAAIISISLIAWGCSVAVGSERASMHSQLTSQYRSFLETWKKDHLPLMQSVKMRLVIGGNGDQQEVELTMIKRPT